MVFYPDIPSGFFLLCTSSGITGSVSLNFSSISNGQVYRDGTVSWSARNFSSIADLTYLVDNLREVMYKIGYTIPYIDFSKATRVLIKSYTNTSTSWVDNEDVLATFSGYYELYGSGKVSNYTSANGVKAFYIKVNGMELARNACIDGRDLGVGPVWVPKGSVITIGYVGFSDIKIFCIHNKES